MSDIRDENNENETVDLDLKAEDSRLREAVGQPTTVRIDGVVVHIAHLAEWPASATKAAARGDWDAWASDVIDNDDELEAFNNADLLNYQLEAVFDECAKQGNMTAGKSRRSGSSSRRTQRR
jgi:hypothetical protein